MSVVCVCCVCVLCVYMNVFAQVYACCNQGINQPYGTMYNMVFPIENFSREVVSLTIRHLILD